MTDRRLPPRRAPHSGRLLPAQERTVVIAAQQGGIWEREQLIATFMPSIVGLARIYRRSSSLDRSELIQDGVVGVLRALERFDPELEVPFWGYATWWVRQAMQQLVSERCRPTVMSDRALRQLARVKDAQRGYEQRHHTAPSCDELATSVGLSRAHVESLLASERPARGLDEPAAGQAAEGATVGELLVDPEAERPYESAPDRILVAEVPRLLSGLSDRQRGVVCARFGIGAPQQTLREVAGTLGVSAERVRQIEQTALEQMHEAVDAT